MLVNPRCRKRTQSGHKEVKTLRQNAYIYGPGGEPLARFSVGDAVSHVQSDRAGHFWCAYSDEGQGPLAEDSLNCFDSSGEVVRRFPSLNILDCYALNVAKEAVWLCYYTGFPIVRIGFDGRVQRWKGGIVGAYAIAGSGSQIALLGGYGERCFRLSLVQLDENGDSALIREMQIENYGPAAASGRGQLFHTLQGGLWCRLNVRELNWRGR